jgi:hypothetical protein
MNHLLKVATGLVVVGLGVAGCSSGGPSAQTQAIDNSSACAALRAEPPIITTGGGNATVGGNVSVVAAWVRDLGEAADHQLRTYGRQMETASTPEQQKITQSALDRCDVLQPTWGKFRLIP